MAQEDLSPSRFQEYRDLFDIFCRYWKAFGGWKELAVSPYVHISALVTMICSGYWMSMPWHGVALAVLPNLLGFGVTGYAIWIGWGDERLRETLIGIDSGEKGSLYVQISAIFAHFGLVQITALMIALLCASLDYELSPKSTLAHVFLHFGQPATLMSFFRPAGAAFGYFFFVYAILTALETTLALFRMAGWLQTSVLYAKAQKKTEPPPPSAGA